MIELYTTTYNSELAGLTGGDIALLCRRAAMKALDDPTGRFNAEHFMKEVNHD